MTSSIIAELADTRILDQDSLTISEHADARAHGHDDVTAAGGLILLRTLRAVWSDCRFFFAIWTAVSTATCAAAAAEMQPAPAAVGSARPYSSWSQEELSSCFAAGRPAAASAGTKLSEWVPVAIRCGKRSLQNTSEQASRILCPQRRRLDLA